MSQQERAVRGTIICLLPEMVSSLRKEIYFFDPQAELARRSQISSTPLELAPIYQEWKSFEFVTKKKGAYGPTKSECLSYYAEKYAYL